MACGVAGCAYHSSPAAVQAHAAAIRRKGGTLVPYTNGPHEGAQIMQAQEVERLERARLYFVNEDMTAVANRKAVRPRPLPLTAARVPSPYGLMVFSAPIGSYTRSRPGYLDVHVPFVAVSWGLWRGDWAPVTGVAPNRLLTGAGYTEGWQSFMGGMVTPQEPGEPDIYWFTGYTSMPGRRAGGPLHWDTEACAELGHAFDGPAAEGTGEVFMRATVAAWDLITQEAVTGQPIVDVEQVERKPVKARQDRRRGIEDNGDVLVVSATRRRRRPPAQRRGPGTGRTYAYRQLVEEHDRNHCMDPRNHRRTVEEGQACYHEPITIPEHWRGDDSLPVREKVTVLDRPVGDGS